LEIEIYPNISINKFPALRSEFERFKSKYEETRGVFPKKFYNARSGDNTPFQGIRIVFKIERYDTCVLGDKISNNHGGKGTLTLIEKDENIVGNTGGVGYDSFGNGSIYQVFFGAGVTFWDRLSLGAEALYYFGNIDKVTNMNYSNSSYRSVNSGNDLSISAFTGKFGLQYEQKLGGNVSMVLGATYRLGTDMKGYSTEYRYANLSSVTDTLRYNVDTLAKSGIRIADEVSVGIALKGGDKWSAEFNYSRSDWTKSGFDKAPGFAVSGTSKFTSTVSQSYRAGFEITPNRNDIRYFLKRCTYRGGVYHEQSYYKLDGNNVNSTGITLGVTLPVFRLYNGLTLGIDLGQRSNAKNNMIRERYAMFAVGFNIHDLWFRKTTYE
jgi:hypothetical protein